MATTSASAAQKWANNLGAATQHITDGVNAVTQAPGQAAAAQQALWLARVQASANKWAKNTSAVSLQDWQSAMINKGVPRVASGAQAALPKFTAFMDKFLPYAEGIAAQVRAMPKGTIDQSIARAAAQIRGNANFPGYR